MTFHYGMAIDFNTVLLVAFCKQLDVYLCVKIHDITTQYKCEYNNMNKEKNIEEIGWMN